MRLVPLLLLFACNGSTEPDETGDPAPDTCHGDPGDADRVRKLVHATPFDDSGAQSGGYQVCSVDPADPGLVCDPADRFEMGRAFMTEIVFSPDGVLGAVAQDDGTVGLFSLQGDTVQVVHADFGAGLGSFYATQVVWDEDGEALWVVDGNWRENGGGLYKLSVDCDGTLTDLGLVVAAKQPMGLTIDGDRAFVAARDLGDSADGDNAHLIALDGSNLASGPAFPDDEASVAHAVWTDDRAFALVSDNSMFSGLPNRVSVVATGEASVGEGVVVDVPDPVWMTPSTFDDGVLISSGFENDLVWLPRNADSWGTPNVIASSPLAGAHARLTRGVGSGLVVVAENTGVHFLRFDGAGGLDDLGTDSTGTTTGSVVGAIGMQP